MDDSENTYMCDKSPNMNDEMTGDFAKLQDRVLLEPFEYVSKIPGKKIRTKLIQVWKLVVNLV